MEIKNRVILTLNNGETKSFSINRPLHEIKRKYAVGRLFLANFDKFTVGVIESMTCYSEFDYKKVEVEQVKKNMSFVNRIIKK